MAFFSFISVDIVAHLVKHLPMITFLLIVTLITSHALEYHYFWKNKRKAQILFYAMTIARMHYT